MTYTQSETSTRLLLSLLRINGPLALLVKTVMQRVGLGPNEWRVVYIVMRPGGHDLTAAAAGRRLRLPRQTVQRIADDLERRGLLEFLPNPYHKSAPILKLTEGGRNAFSAGHGRQYDLADWLTRDLSEAEARAALNALDKLEKRLERTTQDMLENGAFPRGSE
jgi:DNA-binding MarR family transcriptional regulator